MRFNYQARTKNGEIHTGNIEASSQEAAISLLQGHNLYVTFLEEEKVPFYAKKIKLFERISKKDLVLFSRQLSIMFKSKVSLTESLKVISSQTKNSDFKEKLVKLSEEVEGGTPFSKTLSQHPKIFSPFYIAMVKSGEVSGKLSEALDYLADHLEREYHLASKTKGALIYPAMVVLVIILVMFLMVYFVIPNLTKVLATSEASLPVITQMVIAASGLLRSWAWLFILLLILLIFVSRRLAKTKGGKKFLDEKLLKVPLVGNLLKMIYVARFSENLSTLISGGLPITQALDTVGDIIGHASYKKVIFEAREKVRRGETISSVLSQYPDLFPPLISQMVTVGEKTGTLDTTLMNVVYFYQKEIDRSIDNLLSVMEPVLIIFLGGTVGLIMLSLLMPLYRMVSI